MMAMLSTLNSYLEIGYQNHNTYKHSKINYHFQNNMTQRVQKNTTKPQL